MEWLNPSSSRNKHFSSENLHPDYRGTSLIRKRTPPRALSLSLSLSPSLSPQPLSIFRLAARPFSQREGGRGRGMEREREKERQCVCERDRDRARTRTTPSTLKHNSLTLNPQPSTLKPQTQLPNPEP